MTGSDLVLASRTGRVEKLTLNRAARYNALSEDLLAALQGELDRLATDADLGCVVLAAAGKAFSAGHDLDQMHALADEAALRTLFARCSAVMLSLRALPVPVIAQVQGMAVAAGCQLVAACDLAIAARSATFAVSGIDLGLFCSTPAVALSRAVAPKAALEMLMTGRFVTAEEAEVRGLINRAVADDELDKTVGDLAAAICAKSPEAVRLGKRMFYAQRDMGLEEAYGFAGEVMARNMMGRDARAGVGAFIGRKRKAPS
jgi:enoyl-CoA hydratase/carnithine racemase